MADHVRKQIRVAALAALTGLATTASRAYASRLDPLDDGASELPALLVDTLEEDNEGLTLGGASRIAERTLTLQVRAVVEAVSGYQDTADQIAKEVEIALANNNGLGGLCKWIALGSQNTELSGEGEKPVAVCTMNFSVLYLTALNAPDVPL
jgi:hypothetical protein